MKTLIPTCLVETDSASSSGIIIDARKGYVITHATVLLPHLANRFAIFKRLLKEKHLRGDAFEDLIPVQVTFEQRQIGKSSAKEWHDRGDFKSSGGFVIEPINVVVSGSDPALLPSRMIKREGQLRFVWRSENLAGTIRRLFPTSEWKFIEDLPQDKKTDAGSPEISKEQVYHMLPYFVLIQVPGLKDFVVPATEKTIIQNEFTDVRIGTEVLVVATPFGNLSPEVFLNSVSGGIISNLAGERRELMLTDARCIPGSEGGAIYEKLHLNRNPIGMVIAPLCWKANEWVGLAIGCSISEILRSLRKSFGDSITGPGTPLNGTLVSSSSPFDSVSIVLVSSGAMWGSGILINQDLGLIVTCSHVLNGAREVKVRTDIPHFAWRTAEVIYATTDDQVFDFALLRLKDFQPISQWPMVIDAEKDIMEGTEVFVVGHAAFGQENRLKPTVTHGVISKVLFIDHIPIVIQTSCSVNSGASGGAIVNRNGQLLGIIVCNARNKDCGATYPHLNLSIPAATVWPAVRRYMESGKTLDLESLTLKDPRAKLLWTLKSTETKLMDTVKSQL